MTGVLTNHAATDICSATFSIPKRERTSISGTGHAETHKQEKDWTDGKPLRAALISVEVD